ncbi:hypothetical protein [Caulobacter phage KcrB]|nr:hypothetical protein RW_GP045 [Caulobacter phage RW]WCA46349.1 hypothetical protein [Caulobacter phage KcrB]WCD56284.1 hypothetical protein [Caulobacter phage RLK]WNV48076.1 hypothetical protein GB2A_gp044 [Caulobacter phage GB2A]
MIDTAMTILSYVAVFFVGVSAGILMRRWGE